MKKDFVIGCAACFVFGIIGMNTSTMKVYAVLTVFFGIILLISLVVQLYRLLLRNISIPSDLNSDENDSLLLKWHKSNLKAKGIIVGKGWWIWHDVD